MSTDETAQIFPQVLEPIRGRRAQNFSMSHSFRKYEGNMQEYEELRRNYEGYMKNPGPIGEARNFSKSHEYEEI